MSERTITIPYEEYLELKNLSEIAVRCLSEEEGEALKKKNAELQEKIDEMKYEPCYRGLFHALLFYNFLGVLAFIIGECILN